MVEFRFRLLEAMEHAKVGRDALRSKLRVTRVAIDKLLDGRSKSMSAENCALTADYLGVCGFWLATGQGSMLPNKEPFTGVREKSAPYTITTASDWPMQEVSLQEYRTLNERQQGYIEGQVRLLLAKKSNGGRDAA